ncbi:hypothetical protein MIR68_009581 [Amoeboaphelidium protococcarum]|nr:hypothetical protein MIR68_009581 [Amoeboaphelidium protococcarum]
MKKYISKGGDVVEEAPWYVKVFTQIKDILTTLLAFFMSFVYNFYKPNDNQYSAAKRKKDDDYYGGPGGGGGGGKRMGGISGDQQVMQHGPSCSTGKCG